MTAVANLAWRVQAWLRTLDEDELEDEFGTHAMQRGQAYAKRNRVLTTGTSADPHTLSGTVIGGDNRLYDTSVTASFDAGGVLPDYWWSECSCPLGGDCKHVAGLILVARSKLGIPERGSSAPARVGDDWERVLGPLATVRQAEPPRPLALELTLQQFDSRWTGPTTKLLIRPLTRGKRGAWIKTGVSWDQLLAGRQGVPVDEQHRLLLRRIRLAADARVGHGYGSSNEVDVADLGPDLWPVLAEARLVGVELVCGKGLDEVVVEEDRARLELRAEELPTGVRLRPELSLGGQPLPTADTHLLGVPAHGGFVLRSTGTGHLQVQLVAFDQAVDAHLADLLRAGGVEVPSVAIPRLTTDFLPGLRQRMTVTGDEAALREPTVTGPLLVVMISSQHGHRLSLRHVFRYLVGGRPVDIATEDLAPAVRGLPRRDLVGEHSLLRELDYLAAVPGALSERPNKSLRLHSDVLLDGVDTARYVELVLPRLEADDRVVVERPDDLPAYTQVTDAPVITVSVSDPTDGPQTDWFDLGVTVSVAGEQVPFQPLFTALAARQDHLLLDSGTWFSLDRAELTQLRALIEEAWSLSDPDSPGLRLNRLHGGLWEELVELGVVAEQSERWQRSVGTLLGLEELPEPAPPDRLKAELRPYQQRGYAWLSLLWDHGLGGILADDMGLGKTVQTLALAQRAKERDQLTSPLLVVCPTSVISTWAEQAALFCPDLRVGTVTATGKRRAQEIADLAGCCDVLITSYTLLRLEADAYHALTWTGLIMDEAQAVKNYRAKTYQAARRIDAGFRLAITGTPLENSLMDLWALLSLTAPGLYPSPEQFSEQYQRPIEHQGDAERLARLRRRIRPLMLRRRKEEVAPELPPKIEQVLSVELTPAHRRIYARQLQRERQRVLGLLDDVQRNRIAILTALTKLRQLALAPELVDPADAAAGSAKLDSLMEHIGEVVAEGHRALVFSQFTGFLGLLRHRLDAAGVPYAYLDGRTRNRAARIEAFRSGDDPLFLISLKAGGFGLTLTEADYVFVLDPWWNPAAEEQAIDRTHRIGQQQTVMVYRLVATDTIEEKVLALQERKRRLFGDVIEGDGGGSAPLTADDIRELLRG